MEAGPGDRGVVYSRTDRERVLAASDDAALEELWRAFETGMTDSDNNLTPHPGLLHVAAGIEVRVLRRNPRGALWVRPAQAAGDPPGYWVLPENYQSVSFDADEMTRPPGEGEASYE